MIRNLYIIIGVKGEVYFNSKDKFERSYRLIERPYVYEENVHDAKYVPTLKDLHSGITYHLSDYTKLCEPTGIVIIYARVLERGVKVFTHWDEEKYMVGRP